MAYLTSTEAALRLRVSDQTIRRMVNDGRLEGFRLAGEQSHYRVSSSSLRRFVTNKSAGGGVVEKRAV